MLCCDPPLGGALHCRFGLPWGLGAFVPWVTLIRWQYLLGFSDTSGHQLPCFLLKLLGFGRKRAGGLWGDSLGGFGATRYFLVGPWL